MKMIYFLALPPENLKELDELIGAYIPAQALETYRDITSLSQRLSQPTDNVSVVLLAADKDSLQKLQVLQEQLHKLRLIIVLPDKDQETAALSNNLQPRFLSYTFGNFSVVKTVLKKYCTSKTHVLMPSRTQNKKSHLRNDLYSENKAEIPI